jgi:sortase A
VIRSRLVFVSVSLLFISVGLETVSYAGVGVPRVNSNLGALNSPKLEFSMKTQAKNSLSKPKIGQVIGTLSIPRLKRDFPIIEGTSSKELKRGVGHYVRSVLPGVSDNSVLSGHRGTVFRNLGNIKIEDLLIVTTEYGEFIYEVYRIRIVKANDKTVIVPNEDAILTLSTCYPFIYKGNAPKRYIVQASLVNPDPSA